MGLPNTFFWKMLKKNLLNIISNYFFYLKVQSFWLIMEYNSIQMAASAVHAVAYTIGLIFEAHYRLCAVVVHQWLHEYCPLKRQLPLACRRNAYLLRHPTNNNATMSNPSSEVGKLHQLCG